MFADASWCLLTHENNRGIARCPCDSTRFSCVNVVKVCIYLFVCLWLNQSEEQRSAQDDSVRVHHQSVASQQRRRLSARSPEIYLHISQAFAASLRHVSIDDDLVNFFSYFSWYRWKYMQHMLGVVYIRFRFRFHFRNAPLSFVWLLRLCYTNTVRLLSF